MRHSRQPRACRTLSVLASMAMAMAGLFVAGATGQADADRSLTFSIIDLGTLFPGGSGYCEPGGLNDRGEVVGSVIQAPDAQWHAFLWRHGVMTDVSFPGLPDSFGVDINDRGEIVGTSQDPNPGSYQRQSWVQEDDGSFTTLGSAFWASSLNSRGVVAGVLDRPGTRTAALWNEGVFTLLPPDGYQSDASASNDHGAAVGEVYVHPSNPPPGATVVVHAALWQDGRVFDLGRLGPPFGNTGAGAIAINDRNWIVGMSDAPGTVEHAFLWRDGAMVDLGTVAGFTDSRANAIDDFGDIVGSSGGYSTAFGAWVHHATLWHDGHAIDLNSLRPPGFAGTLIDASAVNERGQILGTFSADPAAPPSRARCFLMTPRYAGVPG